MNITFPMSKKTTVSGIRTRKDDLLVTAVRLLCLWQEVFGQNEKPLTPADQSKVRSL